MLVGSWRTLFFLEWQLFRGNVKLFGCTNSTTPNLASETQLEWFVDYHFLLRTQSQKAAVLVFSSKLLLKCHFQGNDMSTFIQVCWFSNFWCLAQGLHRRNFWDFATPCLVVGRWGPGFDHGDGDAKPVHHAETELNSHEFWKTKNAVFIMCTLHTHIIRYLRRSWDPHVQNLPTQKHLVTSTLKVNWNPCFRKSWHLRLRYVSP